MIAVDVDDCLQYRRHLSTEAGMSRVRSTTGVQESTTQELTDLLWAAVEDFGGGFVLLRAVRDGVQFVDWQVEYANTFIRNRWLQARPAIGARASEVLTETTWVQFDALMRSAVESGVRQEGEMLVDAPEGAAWRRVVSMPLAGDAVAAMTFDISDMVDLQARAAALSDHVWDIVAITDTEARIKWVSPAAKRVLGYEQHALIGCLAADLIYPEDLDATMQRFADVVAEPGHSGTPIEVRQIGRASCRKECRSRWSPYH